MVLDVRRSVPGQRSVQSCRCNETFDRSMLFSLIIHCNRGGSVDQWITTLPRGSFDECGKKKNHFHRNRFHWELMERRTEEEDWLLLDDWMKCLGGGTTCLWLLIDSGSEK